MPPTIYIKRGLNDALTAVNPVLGSGEMVFVRDTNTIVVGNGSGVYSSLSGISANPLTHTHSNITITAGSGLAGGGSLAENRTIDIGQGDGISVSADSIAVDSTVIRTTGVQTISGAKTFTAATVFSTGITISSSGTNVPLTITHDGTGNCFVVNDVTGDTSPFIIDSSGNVGIGTDQPKTNIGKSLHMYNDANTGTVASNSYVAIQSVNRNSVIELCGSASAINALNFSTSLGTSLAGVCSDIANQAIFFRTGGTSERMRITSSGNVGIGTSSPVFALQIRESSESTPSDSYISIWGNVTGSNSNTGGIRFYNHQSNPSADPVKQIGGIYAARHGDNYGGSLSFLTANASTGSQTLSTRMFIDSSGNVGIGTTTPTFVNNTYSGLHIHAATATSLKLTNTTTGQTSTDGFELLQDAAGNAYIWNRENTNISIATSGTSRITITSDGNVGIGSTSPTHRLEVVKSSPSSLGAIARFYHGPSSDRSFEIGVHETTPFPVYIQARNTGTTTNNISIQPYGGDVLIGTTTDQGSFRLQVENNAWMDNLYLSTTTNWGRLAIGHNGATTFAAGFNNTDTSSTGQTTVNILRNGTSVGSITTTNAATSYNTNSDYRLKNNVTNMVGASVRLLSLRPVTFEWKVGGSGEGFIAHELAEAVPLAVTGEKDAKDSYYGMPIMQSVDHSKLVPLLVSALQEAYAEIANIKSRLSSLEQK
jgi:hypothetical protein